MPKLTSIAAILLASPSRVLEGLSDQKAGAIFLVLAFLAGSGATALFGDVMSHEERIHEVEQVVGLGDSDTTDLADRVTVLETWQTAHVRQVTRPQIRRIGSVEEDVGQIETWMDRIDGRLEKLETLTACQHYGIRNCPGAPPPPPTGTGP